MTYCRRDLFPARDFSSPEIPDGISRRARESALGAAKAAWSALPAAATGFPRPDHSTPQPSAHTPASPRLRIHTIQGRRRSRYGERRSLRYVHGRRQRAASQLAASTPATEGATETAFP